MRFVPAACAAITLVLVTGACAGDDAGNAVSRDTTLATTPSGTTGSNTATTPANANRIAFAPVGGSTLTGDVKVEEDDGRTEVEAEIRNSTDGAVHKGHIHTGTCSAIGPVVAPLNDIRVDGDRDGDSDTDLQIPLATVMNGQHIVVFHAAGGDPGAPAVCAAIPARS